MRKLYEAHPDDYAVNSNLAILYKKKGNYATAYSYMKRALEIKPEGHMGLGDWLKDIGDKNLALRAYMRAKLLKHPNHKVIVARIDAVIQQLKFTRGVIEKQDLEIRKFKKELEGATAWRRDFEKIETELVNLTHFPSLTETESKMNSKRFYPIGKVN